MIILNLDPEPRVASVRVTDEHLIAYLEDGRAISVPLEWFPRLLHGSPAERQRYELSGGGYGIHWPDLDEDISIEGLLEGRRSGESERSFRRWLEARRGAAGPHGSSSV
jgi:hypothetical protein